MKIFRKDKNRLIIRQKVSQAAEDRELTEAELEKNRGGLKMAPARASDSLNSGNNTAQN